VAHQHLTRVYAEPRPLHADEKSDQGRCDTSITTNTAIPEEHRPHIDQPRTASLFLEPRRPTDPPAHADGQLRRGDGPSPPAPGPMQRTGPTIPRKHFRKLTSMCPRSRIPWPSGRSNGTQPPRQPSSEPKNRETTNLPARPSKAGIPHSLFPKPQHTATEDGTATPAIVCTRRPVSY